MEHVAPESESTAVSQVEVIPARRRLSGSHTIALQTVVAAAMAYYPTGGGPRVIEFGSVRSGTPKRHPRGPCRICGKPDVAAGWRRGVYLCSVHLHLEHAPTTA
jgi:hypothetical protein